MKRLAAIALALTSWAHASPVIHFVMPVPSVTDAVILNAIAIRESGDNPEAIGALGERTQYQFLARTWHRYSWTPLSQAASHPDEVARVAHAYLLDIRLCLMARGLPESPYFIAISWISGPHWTRSSATAREYAKAVENLAKAAQVEPLR